MKSFDSPLSWSRPLCDVIDDVTVGVSLVTFCKKTQKKILPEDSSRMNEYILAMDMNCFEWIGLEYL